MFPGCFSRKVTGDLSPFLHLSHQKHPNLDVELFLVATHSNNNTDYFSLPLCSLSSHLFDWLNFWSNLCCSSVTEIKTAIISRANHCSVFCLFFLFLELTLKDPSPPCSGVSTALQCIRMITTERGARWHLTMLIYATAFCKASKTNPQIGSISSCTATFWNITSSALPKLI